MVGTISARNTFLDEQNPTYAIKPSGDSDWFAITDGNQLIMVSAATDPTTYTVTITATGDSVFEDDNNRRTIQVTRGGRFLRYPAGPSALDGFSLDDQKDKSRLPAAMTT